MSSVECFKIFPLQDEGRKERREGRPTTRREVDDVDHFHDVDADVDIDCADYDDIDSDIDVECELRFCINKTMMFYDIR